MLIRNEEEANRAKTIPILSLCSYCENMLTYPYLLTIERSNKNRYHPDCAAKLVAEINENLEQLRNRPAP